jgi:hypothetical protein
VNEQQWLACTDARPMLEFLRPRVSPSERKHRLFGCACVRRLWPLLADERIRTAVEVAEEYVDGQLEIGVKQRAQRNAHDAAGALHLRVRQTATADARRSCEVGATAASAAFVLLQEGSVWGYQTAGQTAGACAAMYAVVATKFAARASGAAGRPAAKSERAAQCLLLRDVFGNPFRQLPRVNPWSLRWNGATVKKLADACYTERHLPEGTLDNCRLAILADALEEAGCIEGELLGHLRGPGPHVRGCWALDVLLEKE